jgi:hypothetical protein
MTVCDRPSVPRPLHLFFFLVGRRPNSSISKPINSSSRLKHANVVVIGDGICVCFGGGFFLRQTMRSRKAIISRDVRGMRLFATERLRKYPENRWRRDGKVGRKSVRQLAVCPQLFAASVIVYVPSAELPR